MSGGGRPHRSSRAREASPPRFEDALARARHHARAAAAEAAQAARALLDAAALGATGVPAAGHEPLRGALRWLDEIAARGERADGMSWLAALGDALDAEIARWERRSRSDPEARGVLRAFLGLRELLWELGLRAAPTAPAAPPPEAAPRRRARGEKTRPAAARRLERVPIEGGGPSGRAG
jgi:hypothetical protein